MPEPTINSVPSGYSHLQGLSNLGLDSTTESALDSMLKALGTDDAVPGYLDIAEVLSVFLAEEVSLTPALNRIWRRWRKLNSILLAKAKKRWADPLKDKTEKYPMLVCLLQPSALPQKHQILALKRLLILGCMLREAKLPIQNSLLRQTANQVNLACVETGERSRLVQQLPSGSFGQGYLVDLSKKTSELLPKTHSGKPPRRMIRPIYTLAEAVLMLKTVPVRRRVVKSLEPTDPLSNFGGLIALNSADEPEDDGEVDQFQLLVEPVIKPGDELSNKGFNATGLQSRSWLAQTQCGVLWQRSRISPYEWPRLQKLLHHLPKLVKDGRLTITQAVSVALVAATGLDIEDILALEIGPHADLTWAGAFRRKFTAPEHAFRPTVENREWFDTAPVTEIALQFPATVKSLLRAVTPNEPSRTYRLGQVLGFQSSNADEEKILLSGLRTVIGDLLREYVNKRLEHRHLQTVLRNTSFDYTQDPVWAYLIAGRPEQAPPVQMYYSRFSADQLREIHRQVVNSIFGDK